MCREDYNTLRTSDKLPNRMIPRIKSCLEFDANQWSHARSRKPQDRLRSAEEECGRLREENARLRAMLGIPELVGDRTALHPGPDPRDSAKASTSFNSGRKDHIVSEPLSWARRHLCRPMGRKGRKVGLFASRGHGLACHSLSKTRRAQTDCTQDAYAPASNE